MDPYVGEIRLFAGTFAPQGWFFCAGQELLIQEYSLLYVVIGNTYGGKVSTTFKLPDLRGRTPMDQGQGLGLTDYYPGEKGGYSTAKLPVSSLPGHKHNAACTINEANSESPASGIWAKTPKDAQGKRPFLYAEYEQANVADMSIQALAGTGGNQPHNNMQPYLALNFIIAWDGIWPPKP